MSQWKNTDNAANSVLWGVAGYNKTANSANRDLFYGNTTGNAYITNMTVGQYGVDTAESRAARAGGVARPAHAGYVVKKTGTGGRAGRIQYETLVAMGSISGDSEDTTFKDYAIIISSQPTSAQGDISNNDVVTFTVTAATVPSGGSLTYLWTYANGASMAGVGAPITGDNSATLSVWANQVANGTSFKVEIGATGAANVVSSNVTLTTVA